MRFSRDPFQVQVVLSARPQRSVPGAFVFCSDASSRTRFQIATSATRAHENVRMRRQHCGDTERADPYQARRSSTDGGFSPARNSEFQSGAGTMAEANDKATTATATSSTAAPETPNKKKAAAGLTFKRYFTKAGVSPYDEIEWELRLAQITDAKGGVIFEQKDVETPKDWSMTATNIVASKYLHGTLDTPERETGVRQLVSRVAETIRDWGITGGYFRTADDAAIFHDELAHLLLQQKAAFNSPVWFNVGCDRIEPNSDAQNWHWNAAEQKVEFGAVGYKKPQCSACFINSVHDSLDSILTLAKTEGMLFKWGSGTGSNLSPLRSSAETLSGGGTASGPLSFMKGFDAFAGVIKSGGKTRRAAKMVILNIDHPDIVDFIECKQKEEAKAWALVEHGYDGSGPDSEAYASVFFQNANNSVRVTDDFMYAVVRDRRLQHQGGERRPSRRDLQGPRPAAQDLRRHLALRRSRHAVRHHHQSLAHLEEHRAHQRLESLQRVHVPRRLRLQPGVAQPDEVRAQRNLRRRSLPPRLRHRHHRAGNPGRQQRLSHRSHLAQLARLPSARPRLRQPGRAAHGLGPALRLRRRTRLRRLRHRHHVRRGVSAVVEDRRALPAARAGHAAHAHRRDHRRSLPRLVRQPRAIPRRHSHAPRLGQQDQPEERARRALCGQRRHLGRSPRSTARSSATATRRSPCSRPPAPSAS